MSAGTCPVPGWLPFRRIVDVPFETCLAAIESGQRTGPNGELRIGESRLRGPIEHDRDSGTRRIEVRLARGLLRPLLHMRLNVDRWSSSSTALELIPCGRVRPTAAYFRAGHLLLDSLARFLSQRLPAAHARGTESQPRGHRSRASLTPPGAASPSGSGGVNPAVPPSVRYPDRGRTRTARPLCPGTPGAKTDWTLAALQTAAV